MKKSELTQGEIGEYYRGYIDLLDDDLELLPGLEQNTEEFIGFLKAIPSEKWNFRYEPGKWSILEMIQHIIDTERIFQYRALCFARNEQNPLPGFDHDLYVLNSHAEKRKSSDLVEEYEIVRKSGIYLFRSFSETMLKTIGNMNDVHASARGLGFIMIGHAMHHVNVLKEKYMNVE